jgi:hypothetical protein
MDPDTRKNEKTDGQAVTEKTVATITLVTATTTDSKHHFTASIRFISSAY